MLRSEHGGLNEIFADVARDVYKRQVPDGEKWNAVFNLNINPVDNTYYKNFALIITNDVDRDRHSTPNSVFTSMIPIPRSSIK